LAQALQFELMLRQKDVIGEWVPDSEPGENDIHHDGRKWFRGIRGDAIDGDMILRHDPASCDQQASETNGCRSEARPDGHGCFEALSDAASTRWPFDRV
jgi:hypothetical protein